MLDGGGDRVALPHLGTVGGVPERFGRATSALPTVRQRVPSRHLAVRADQGSMRASYVGEVPWTILVGSSTTAEAARRYPAAGPGSGAGSQSRASSLDTGVPSHLTMRSTEPAAGRTASFPWPPGPKPACAKA